MSPLPKETKTTHSSKKIPVIIIFAALILISPFIIKFMADNYAVSKINKALALSKNHCNGIYDSAGYDIRTRSLQIKNFSIICFEEEAVHFDLIKFTDMDSIMSGSIPLQMLAEFDNAVINADAKVFGRFGEIASQIGVTAVNYRGRFYYSLSPDTDIFSFTINADNIGVMAGEIQIDNPAPIDNDFIKTVERLMDTPVTSLNVAFKDMGFMDMVLNTYAQSIKTDSSAKALDKVLMGLENRIRNANNINPKKNTKLEEIYKFIQNPGEISASISKEDNISIRDTIDSLDYSDWKAFTNSFENFKPILVSNK